MNRLVLCAKDSLMNDLLTKELLEQLANATGDHLVALYMPTHHLPTEAQQNQIGLKNLLNDAEEQLKGLDVRTPEIRELLQPGRELLENALFWRHQSDGLALFLRAGEAQVLRLPIQFRQLVVVGDFWHVKPLLPLL